MTTDGGSLTKKAVVMRERHCGLVSVSSVLGQCGRRYHNSPHRRMDHCVGWRVQSVVVRHGDTDRALPLGLRERHSEGLDSSAWKENVDRPTDRPVNRRMSVCVKRRKGTL